LAEDQTGGARAIIERKIEEFENRVLVEKGHRAIFEFDFGAAIVRGNHVALTDGQVRLGRFPLCLLVGQRVAMGFPGKAHITLDQTEADNPGMARVGRRRLDAYRDGE